MLRRKKARMAPVRTVTNMMFLFNSFQKQPQILRCLPLSVGVSKWRKEEICLLAVGFGASQEKWSNLRSIIIPTPLPLAEKSQKRGRLLCRTKVLTGGRRGVDLWESSGLLPLTWFDPHGPMPRGHIFWEPNKSSPGFQWLKGKCLANRVMMKAAQDFVYLKLFRIFAPV